VVVRAAAVVLVLLALLTGCSAAAKTPPAVRVNAGSQTVGVQPTQYCLGGSVQRYQVQPPVVQVDPGMTITLTVPDAVAQRGWSVQVWDEKLQEQIGNIDVDRGKAVFEVNSSDAVPAAYYLVVVEHPASECHEISGAWPVGFIRAGT
jgi:hypothetical protein